MRTPLVDALPRFARAGLLAGLLSFAALPSQAQDAPIATASATATPAATAPGAVAQIPQVRDAPYEDIDAMREYERRPHGMVAVGVGTGGYRHAAGVITTPIGKTGQVTVAVEKTEGLTHWR